MTSEKPARRRGRGRPVEHRLGENLAIAYVLARPGAQTSPGDLADLLSIDEQRAREVIAALGNETTETDTDDIVGPALALCSESKGRCRRISSSSAIWPRRLRLTKKQADASCEALDRLGLSRDNPIRKDVEQALYPVGYVPEPNIYEPMTTPEELSSLIVFARSIVRAAAGQNDLEVEQPIVEFDYTGQNDSELPRPRSRQLIPLVLRLHEGSWWVDGYDLDARAGRTYLVRSMLNVRLREHTARATISGIEHPDHGRTTITCDDEDTARTILALDGARLEDGKTKHPVVSVSYYRGEWLPRHLIPLREHISFDNEELRRAMVEVAKSDLKKARRMLEAQARRR